MSAAATLPLMSHPGTLPLIRIFTASLPFLHVYHERGGDGMTKRWGLPEDRRRWWRGHMPLKQEQASPERPRCMGGANEHWGFRNPSRRQTEQRENINGLKATLKDNKTDKAGKDFQTTPGSFARRLNNIRNASQVALTASAHQWEQQSYCLYQLHSMYPGRENKKNEKKKVRKSHAPRAGWAVLFRPGARFSWGAFRGCARPSYCLPLGSREVILQ